VIVIESFRGECFFLFPEDWEGERTLELAVGVEAPGIQPGIPRVLRTLRLLVALWITLSRVWTFEEAEGAGDTSRPDGGDSSETTCRPLPRSLNHPFTHSPTTLVFRWRLWILDELLALTSLVLLPLIALATLEIDSPRLRVARVSTIAVGVSLE